MNKQIFHSIPEALSFIESLKSKIDRMPDLLGFKSNDIAKNYRSLIQISNSLSIIFMQYDLNDMALLLLKYSSDADTKLHRFGSHQDKLWEGSLLTYNNLILLFHKVKHYKESLKLVFQAQNFILNIKKSKAKVSAELEITTHILSFISLWRVGRSSDCISYIQSATDLLNDIIEQRLATKLTENALDNLYGLVASCLAAVKAVVEKNKTDSISIIKKTLNDISRAAAVRSILENLQDYIERSHSLKLPEEAENDWLCTQMFEKLMLVTCFVPLIDHRTPIIKAEDLESVQQQVMIEESPKKVVKERPKRIEERNFNLKWDGKRENRVKPWWESKAFLNEVEARGREPSFASEPRRMRNRVSGSLEVAKGIMFSPSNVWGKAGRSIDVNF